MKYLISAILLLIAFRLDAAEPIVVVEDIPPKQQLEYYEDSPELYALKLMEYYQAAIALKNQIIMLGRDPSQKVETPTLEELDSQEMKTIFKYYKIAKLLEREVLAIPEIELRERLNNCIDEKNIIMKESIEQQIRIKTERDSICNHFLEKMENEYAKKFENSIPILGVSAHGKMFYFNNDAIINDVSVGGRLDINVYPLFYIDDHIDFWAEYTAPRIRTDMPIFEDSDRNIQEEWNCSYYSVGVSWKIPRLIEVYDFALALRFGAGHYWGDGTIYNKSNGYVSWKGYQLHFEAELSKYKWFYPLQLFIAYDTNFPSNNIVFNTGTNSVDLGTSNFSSLAVGLRISLGWHPNFEKEKD